ncbi:UvrD-helicase domain-containing protein [Ruminococcus sp.]|uniref:UvrD-helicase domain-containing protein n=1 Tax=Ruminococcus sp. TaxID=41978 RepID=UPI0025F038D6|nr:UvrD-helicase domain-containing protein [Ruminococcus sp.]MBQ8967641.1 UvrD-helicase domain-containing protein [Ruminococcus sp.]
MSVSWTKDQEKAIESFGRGVTVSAAAGSGKTAVLIERIIRLLTDKKKKIPADRLLAVTFTIDAAAQMRDKLNAAFEKKLREDPEDAWVLQQQDLVQLARISTIDSFCFDMVKENLDRFDFSGGLKILGDAEREIVFDTAFEQAAEELCESDPDEYALLDNFFPIERGELKQAVKALYEHLQSICHTDRWISETSENYRSEEFFEKLYDSAFSRFETQLKAANRLLEDARFCFNYTISAGDKSFAFRDHVKTAEDNMALCEAVYSGYELAARHRDGESFRKIEIEKYKAMRLSGKLPEDVKAIFTDVKERFKQDINDMVSLLKEASAGLDLSKKHLRDNLLEADKVFCAMCRLERRVEEVSYDIKLEKNAVDFSDIELMTKNLLVRETDYGFERTELAEEIRSGGFYQIIMIDEYQDVNDIQEIIFKAVSDTDDLEYMGSNTFIVGDMKQAIYGFRKTNPELFKNCIDLARNYGGKKKLEHISLQKNFRSRREVIGLSNFIFETLMTEGCGQVDYDDNERLEVGASYTERECPAEVMLIDVPEDKSGGLPAEFTESAKRIREMIDKGYPVCDSGEDRPCRQSDFCILVNTNDNIRQATEALSAVGLRAFCEDTDGYIKSREISLTLDILRTVDNPMNDIALAAVMMSPIMGFTADEMTAVRIKSKVKELKRYNHIYQVLSGAAKTADGSAEDDNKSSKYIDMGNAVLQEKCRTAFELIENLRCCAMSMSLEKLIRRIFDVTDLMGITSLYLDSAKKRANLRLLQQYAGDYERSGNEGVTGFLRFIDSVSGNDKAFKNATSVTAGGDSVNVKTYHKSKGLEYPFVFLCTLSKKLIRDDARGDSFKLHKSLGCAFQIKDTRLNVRRVNLYYDYLNEVLEREQKSEKMRLFYVGCTRAKEKLILVCSNEKTGHVTRDKQLAALRDAVKLSAQYEKVPADITAEQDSMLAWSVMALAKLENCNALEEWLGMALDTVPKVKPREAFGVEWYSCSPDDEAAADTADDKAETTLPADPSVVLKLREKFRFKYDRPENYLAAKLTVTEIVSAEKAKAYGDKNPEFFPNFPKLTEQLDDLTAAERGTFTHKFMELADYSKAEISVRDELNRLKSKGLFTEREAKGVYVDKLTKFVHSDFFKRMCSSEDLRREQKFLASVKDLELSDKLKDHTTADGYIQGIADCIFKEPDGWVLVDYKTDNFKSPEEMKKYGTQLMLYKAAFELLLGERVKSSYIYSFKLGEGLEFDL